MTALEWNLLKSAVEKIDRGRVGAAARAELRLPDAIALQDLEQLVRRLLRMSAPEEAIHERAN